MFRNIKISTSPPTVNDDATAGYCKGSDWFDSVTETFYKCIDDADGVADWREVSVSNSVYSSVVSLSSADILSLYTTPKILVSGVADNYIDPISIVIEYTYNKGAYATNTKLVFISKASIGTKREPMFEAVSVLGSTQNVVHKAVPIAPTTTNVLQNYPADDFAVSVAVGNPTTGEGTMKIYTYYRLIPST